MNKALPLLAALCLSASASAEAPALLPTAAPTATPIESAAPTAALTFEPTIEPTDAPTPVPSLTLTMADVSLFRGRTQRILAKREDGSHPADLVWASSRPEVATVDRGLISGIAEGEAVITCSDPSVSGLTAACRVRVSVALLGMDMAVRGMELLPGQSAQAEVNYRPSDATRPALSWSSSNPAAVAVDENGLVTAIAPGSASIQARTAEQPLRTVSMTVRVPALKADTDQLELASAEPATVTLHYFGKDRSKLSFRLSGRAISYQTRWTDDQTCVVSLLPEAAGSASLSVQDTAARGVFTRIGMHVQRGAVAGRAEYPRIPYDLALQNPDAYMGQPVLVQGTVLQVVQESNPLTLRVAIGQRKQRVVYVTAANGSLDPQDAKGHRVTVRGKLAGNFSYQTLWGTALTLPLVEAETVGLK